MDKETWTGMKAGAITGLLFLPIPILILTVASGYSMWDIAVKLSQMPIVSRTGFSIQFILILMTIGLVLLSVFSVALGLVLGIVYVKSTRKLPIRSTQIKAVIFGYVLFILILPIRRFFDIWTLFTILIDSLIFASLFNRWTQTPHLIKVPSNSEIAPSSVTLYCSQCGAAISNTKNKFCVECGKAL